MDDHDRLRGAGLPKRERVEADIAPLRSPYASSEQSPAAMIALAVGLLLHSTTRTLETAQTLPANSLPPEPPPRAV